MEESVVRDVVFSAGEARIRIIQWLAARWEPCLYGTVMELLPLVQLLQINMNEIRSGLSLK